MTSLRALLAITGKDLRRLFRRRVDAFFVFLFPVVYAAFFTQVVSGSAAGANRIRVAVVNQDSSAIAQRLVDRLSSDPGLKVQLLGRAKAEESVRAGRLAAVLVIPKGLDAATAPRVTLAVDPARKGEAGLLEGLLLRVGGELFGEQLREDMRLAEGPSEPDRVPPSSDATRAPAGRRSLAQLARRQPLGVDALELSGNDEKPPVAAAVTLPQGTVWALLACAAAFGASLVGERATGTLRRLRLAPIGELPILLGKGLACFLTTLGVCGILFGGVAPAFGVQVERWDLLLLAIAASGICYTGLMLLIGTLGGSEDSAYRIGWAIVLVLAMTGGAMVPSYLMPAWMDQLSWWSPVRWSLLAFEGAIWRGFDLEAMAAPCGVLAGAGVAAFLSGVVLMKVRLSRGWGS